MRQLTDEDFYLVKHASVSPDGKKMIFVSSELDGDVINVLSLDGPPKPKEVLRPMVKGAPKTSVLANAVFLPDGENVLFLAASEGQSGPFDYDVYNKMRMGTNEFDKLTN